LHDLRTKFQIFSWGNTPEPPNIGGGDSSVLVSIVWG